MKQAKAIGCEVSACQPEQVPAAKLSAPQLQPWLVPRARLVDRLAGCLRHRLTVVQAPAGSGKTTLLAEWKASLPPHEPAVAWFAIDPADDDPRSFFLQVVAAAEVAMPGSGARALALLRASPDASPEQLAFSLAMIRLAGCLSCDPDSYRATRGCTNCAMTTVQRYHGDEKDLLALVEKAKGELRVTNG